MDAELSSTQSLVGVIIIVVAALCLAVGWAIQEEKRRKKLSETWNDVAEGEFHHVEYGDDVWWQRGQRSSMAARSTMRKQHLKLTVVFFNDGRSFVLNGRHDAPYPAGTRVRIRENGHGKRVLGTPASDLH